MNRIFYIAAACALAGCGGSTNPAASSATNALLSAPVEIPEIESLPYVPEADASFATLLNGMRSAYGAGDVTHNDLLDQAAQDYAAVLLDNNHFAHVGPDGSTLRQRVDATGYEWTNIGENLGRGQQTEQQVMQGWTDSPGHHANNINPVFEEFGLGYTENGFDTRWVLVLGTPR